MFQCERIETKLAFIVQYYLRESDHRWCGTYNASRRKCDSAAEHRGNGRLFARRNGKYGCASVGVRTPWPSIYIVA